MVNIWCILLIATYGFIVFVLVFIYYINKKKLFIFRFIFAGLLFYDSIILLFRICFWGAVYILE